jgi:putative spermidine/putrescine transport system substrate-binding protein
VGLSQLLAACGGQNPSALKVNLLNGSIPPQILAEFQKFLQQAPRNGAVDFAQEPQLQGLFEQLQSWKQKGQPAQGDRSTSPADLVTLGDYWLETAIQQGLIQAFEPGQLQGWTQPQAQQWQELVQRNAEGQGDRTGKLWAVPYRWGTLAIGYRKDIFQQRGWQPPTDWRDLWQPTYQRHLSLPNQARLVIGLTLKKLGKSLNTQDLRTVPNLEAELRSLHQQVKLYSSNSYLQPLILGDTWLAVGWSSDLLTAMQRNDLIGAIVPQAGTALWADLWVRPVGSNAASLALINEWLRFCWQPAIASQISVLSGATATAVLTANSADLPLDLRRNPVLFPEAAILQASEFLQPLPKGAIEQYRSLWQQLRQPT